VENELQYVRRLPARDGLSEPAYIGFRSIVASMMAGFGTGRRLPVDLYGKIVLNVIAAAFID
jgi:hypothetical protein